MRANTSPRLQQLFGEMVRARELTEHERYEEARQAFLKIRNDCARTGIRSAHLEWGLAVVCDSLGDFDAAVSHINEALEIDPLAIPYQRSFSIIMERIRAALADKNRDPADATTPRLYHLLVQANESDADSHLAMARHLHHVNDNTGALRVLEALTTLQPASRTAWVLKAAVARALGDEANAQQSEIEATALDAADRSKFAVMARARG